DLEPGQLGRLVLNLEDLEAELRGAPRVKPRRLLDYYTAEGVEYALHRYGLLDFLGRLGYGPFRIAVEPSSSGGDRARLYGRAGGVELLLVEIAVEKRVIGTERVLYVHWTTLRNPRARFSAGHARLPGQDAPGLGLAREIGELYERMARRLGLRGVAFRPSYYHTAFAARHRMQFPDPAPQGRLEAMGGVFREIPLDRAPIAVADGKARLNGEPYAWEPDEMLALLDPPVDPERAPAVAAAREAAHFTLADTAEPDTIPA